MPYVLTGDGKRWLSTWMAPYSLSGRNCPDGMDVDNCPLRKKLAELQAEYDIGYSVLPNGALSFPEYFYDEHKDKNINIMELQNKICNECQHGR